MLRMTMGTTKLTGSVGLGANVTANATGRSALSGAAHLIARGASAVSGRVSAVGSAALIALNAAAKSLATARGALRLWHPAGTPERFSANHEPSKRRLTWPSGAIATLYNAVEPDQTMRGAGQVIFAGYQKRGYLVRSSALPSNVSGT
jgi:hypothetical protein